MSNFAALFRSVLIAPVLLAVLVVPVLGQNEWEVVPESELALERGLAWMARTQGAQGNWESNDLGLVSLGALAFLSAGHMPGRGRYGDNVDRALKYVVKNARPSGLLNIADAQRDLYNHGLAAFVLGQAYGMTDDPQIGKTLERSLKLIANTQCDDGGWDYRAKRQPHGHDLSLSVMQAKALRSAVDSGFEVRNDVIKLAIQSVRDHYKAESGARGLEDRAQDGPGQFTYDGNRVTVAMSACGVVCLQEFVLRRSGSLSIRWRKLAHELPAVARTSDRVTGPQTRESWRRRIVARYALGPRSTGSAVWDRSQLLCARHSQPVSANPARREDRGLAREAGRRQDPLNPRDREMTPGIK
jgi:hypothetical protein